MARRNLFFGHNLHFTGGEHLAIVCHRELGLLRGKELEVALAEGFAPRNAHQRLTGPIEQHEAKITRFLDRDHGRHVLDYQIQKVRRPLQGGRPRDDLGPRHRRLPVIGLCLLR